MRWLQHTGPAKVLTLELEHIHEAAEAASNMYHSTLLYLNTIMNAKVLSSFMPDDLRKVKKGACHIIEPLARPNIVKYTPAAQVQSRASMR
jgi:hypothetical protein